MAGKFYAVVGTWMFKPVEKGVCVFSYDPETAEMELLKRYDPEVAAGQQYYDPKRGVLYIADECDGHPGETAGGGFVRAYKLNPENGELTFLNERRVLMTKTSYFWLDKSGDYAMASCHTGRAGVTKVVRNPDNTFSSCVVYEDVGVVLMRINKDGSLGEVCDVALYPGLTTLPNQVHSHPHSIMADPSGEIFYSCDKGLDMIYSYKIDRERGRIIRKAEKSMDFATAPRYLAFHPTLPVMFENNETSNFVFSFKYCTESGELKEICRVPLLDDAERVSPSDLRVSADGKFLYAAVRGVDKIVVYAVDPETGALSRIQIADCPGGPRGINLSPDGRFLLAANNGANEIRTFVVKEDGTLSDTGRAVKVDFAANVSVIEV